MSAGFTHSSSSPVAARPEQQVADGLNDTKALLRLAVENNVAWCRTICAAHALNEFRTNVNWANLSPSPRYYPNIITTATGAQEETIRLIGRLRHEPIQSGWGIKDSYADLDLSRLGFSRLLDAHWYGGTVAAKPKASWQRVETEAELRAWESGWGVSGEFQFPPSLLADPGIAFWYRGGEDIIKTGFAAIDTGASVGISNWFSPAYEPQRHNVFLEVAASASPGRPLVLWSQENLATIEGLRRLGPLRVWVSTS